MVDGRHATMTGVEESTLRLKLDEEGRTGARIKVIGVGGGGEGVPGAARHAQGNGSNSAERLLLIRAGGDTWLMDDTRR